MMLPLASVLFAYAGVAAAFGGRSRAVRSRWSISPRAQLILYALAAIALGAAVTVWPGSDGAALAGLSVTLAVSAAATLFVLLEPVLPKLVWSLAAAASLAGVALAFAAR
jgi:hypothetical protein